MDDPRYYFQNFELHIGDDPDWTKNPKCPGGPFMTTDAGSNGWVSEPSFAVNVPVWVYGIEIWCNMPGRYTHVIADYNGHASVYSSFVAPLCTLGIMGTRYVRDE